jgi:hypothetical protein
VTVGTMAKPDRVEKPSLASLRILGTALRCMYSGAQPSRQMSTARLLMREVTYQTRGIVLEHINVYLHSASLLGMSGTALARKP